MVIGWSLRRKRLRDGLRQQGRRFAPLFSANPVRDYPLNGRTCSDIAELQVWAVTVDVARRLTAEPSRPAIEVLRLSSSADQSKEFKLATDTASKFLYLDNYRGFSDVVVPLLDVNFLVGENSTGKTSLLSLIKLLSNPALLMGKMFTNEEIDFGHFNEMVSAHATNRTYFRIGFVEERPKPDDENENEVIGFLLTYKEHFGMPRVSAVTLSVGAVEVTVHYVGDEIRFQGALLPRMPTTESMVNSLRRWSDDHGRDSAHLEKLNLEDIGDWRGEIPLYFVLFNAAKTLGAEGKAISMPLPSFSNRLIWIAPIRTKPRRTYDEPMTPFSPEGTHTPYVIRRLLNSSSDARRFEKFMREVGRDSGLFESITIKSFEKAGDAPFEVDAVLDDKALNLSWVGYGVSQALPIFVELLDRQSGSWFAIQQPEVHLHPRAQACLGDVFFEMAVRDRKRFIIETHSDFTIDRFRMNYRQTKREDALPPDGQILFFERRSTRNTVTSLPIGARGQLPPDQPQGYREFFVNEEIRLLES